MKRFCRSSFYAVLGFVVLNALPLLTFAQPGDPGGDPDLPIDGGVGLLIAAGVGYGVKKYRDSRRKTTARS